MTDTTPRFALPFLDAGQAQKEISHNEALTTLDIVAQASVLAIGLTIPPTMPVAGEAWVVGATPSGEWVGQPNAIASWTAGGWRFVQPTDGIAVWSVSDNMVARFQSGTWVTGSVEANALVIGGVTVVAGRRPAIPAAAGGNVIDAESRSAITAILEALRGHGLIEP